MTLVAAVDLGATSGRVMLGRVGPRELSLHPVRRFANNPVRTLDGLHWDILDLYRNVLEGLGAAVREEPDLRSVGVDSWAVDYGLVHGNRLLGNPYHYREGRTADAVEDVHTRVSETDLYQANGLQFLPFNTLYQLAADRTSGALDGADSFLLIPDLLAFWLTGRKVAERTNASTTGLLNVSTRAWDEPLTSRLGFASRLFPELVDAGTSIGGLLPEVAESLAAHSALEVVSVGSHDTASAVVAVPMLTDNAAYISSGTWSLVGVELSQPVLTEASRNANFTNEGGVDGRVRYLHNVMGLWVLNESVRVWQRAGLDVDLSTLVAQASQVDEPVAVFDTDDPRFLPPGDMPARIAAFCDEHDLKAPATPPQYVRSILESLAAAYADTIRQAQTLSGATIGVVHIVGGGSQNGLLCQLTADRTGLTVLAGPVEATAIGNLLVQARAAGLVSGDLESLRALAAAAFPPIAYRPCSGPRRG